MSANNSLCINVIPCWNQSKHSTVGVLTNKILTTFNVYYDLLPPNLTIPFMVYMWPFHTTLLLIYVNTSAKIFTIYSWWGLSPDKYLLSKFKLWHLTLTHTLIYWNDIFDRYAVSQKAKYVPSNTKNG